MTKLHTDKKAYTHKRNAPRVLLIAAVIVLMLSVSAFAVWRFSLRDLQGPSGDTLSVTSIQGTTQYAAAAEWEGYVKAWYDAGENKAEPGMTADEYYYYHAHSPEAKEKLNELLAKYDLKMHGMPTSIRDLDGLYSASGASGFLPAQGDSGEYPVGGRLYEDGTFSFNCAADIPGVGRVIYKFNSCGKEYLNRGVHILADRLEEPEEWLYTTSGGVEVLLALGEYKSILAADMEDCFIFVNIMSGRSNNASGNDSADAARGMPTLDRAALEAFAESFDFEAINGISS